MVASGPRKLLLELESRGGVQESSQTPENPRVYAKRREQRLSAFAVYQCVGQFRGQNISSANESQTCDRSVIKWHPCESTKPPPSPRPPQGDQWQSDPLDNPSGSLHFYPIKSKGSRVIGSIRSSQHVTHPWPIFGPKGL